MFILVDNGHAFINAETVEKCCVCKLEKKEAVEVVAKDGSNVTESKPAYAPLIYTMNNQDGYVYGEPTEDVDKAREALMELLDKMAKKEEVVIYGTGNDKQ